MIIDKFGYLLKKRFRPLYNVAELISGYTVYFFNRKSIRRTLSVARLEGVVKGKDAYIRPLLSDDVERLARYFEDIPEHKFEFFKPHGFSRKELMKVLRWPHFLQYGLFVEDELVGYCILKLYPGKKAFLGTLLSDGYTGCGLGKFLSLYVHWQTDLLGFRMRATIDFSNLASVGSHKSVGGFNVLGELSDNYRLIEFDPGPPDADPPKLLIADSHKAN